MGVNRLSNALRVYPAPTWLTWILLIGLAGVYTGERIVPTVMVARAALSGGGGLLVLAAVIWRLVAWRRAPAEARATERLFFLMFAGCLGSLVLFGLATLAGGAALGADEPGAAARFATAARVAGVIVLAISLLAALSAHWAVGPVRDGGHAGAVDRLRITQLAAAGLVVAMAGATLMLAGYIASQHNKTLDLSYFRTASPGTGVQQIVESMGELQVVLFFPPANEVKDQVLGYFRALGTDNVRIEEHDRLVSPQLAEEYNVTQDGTIVMVAGERTERMALPLELREARRRLRALDGEVRQRLMRVARDQRTVYLTVGHGELNDPGSANPLDDDDGQSPLRSIRALRSLFGQLNYRVQDIGVQGGLGSDIPDDAAMVLVLGPRRPFLEPELASLHRYLDRGGSLLLGLEPGSGFELGPLRERLGVEFHDVPLANDNEREHMTLRGNISDRQLIVTNRFTSHAAVSTVGSAGMNAAILLVGAGYLEPVGESSPATFVVRSLPSTFADVGQDFEFQEGTDERGTYSLVAAITEDDRDGGEQEGEQQQPGMRAVVLADADLFSDAVVSALGMNAALAADAITWLGREEELSGETTSEEDVPIVHTRAEDAAWFYSTILGAPLLVLLFGVVGVRRHRRRGGQGSSSVEGELS